MSLRWKAFLVLFVVLALIHGGLGILGYLELKGDHQHHLREDFADFRRAMASLLGQAARLGDREAGRIAATHPLEKFQQRDAARKYDFAGQFVELSAVGYLDLQGNPLALWQWPSAKPPARGEIEQRRRAARALAESDQPQFYISCAEDCLLHVFVPALQQGRQIVLFTAATLGPTLSEFSRLTGVDVGIVAPQSTDAVKSDFDFWGGRLISVTHAPLLRPLLAAVPSAQAPAGATEPVSVQAQGRELALSLEPFPFSSEGSLQMLLVADQTAALSLISHSLVNRITLSLFGLVLATAAIFILLTPSLRRLTRVTRALVLLADQKFAEARQLIVPAQRKRGLEDEIDGLSRTALALSRRLEQLIGAEAASEAKSQFLAAMSHEIRTPINGLLGLLELHEGTELSQAQRESARIMRDSALTLLTVVDDILDFSKIEAGQLSIDPVPTNLREVIEGALEIMAPAAAAHNLKLVCYVQPGLPQVLADSVRLRQIVLNLCSNAVKFTAQGSVAVQLTAADPDADPVHLRCAVIDTGIGISPEAQGKLFERFAQAEVSTTRRFGGTGLGLSISKGLVEMHGGTIGLVSEPGVGSEFWFELDCIVADPARLDPPLLELKGVVLHVACADARERQALAAYLGHAGAHIASDPEAADLVVEDREGGIGMSDAFGGGRVLTRPVRYRSLVREAARFVSKKEAATDHAPEIPRAVRRRARILVAEDHPTNRLVIKQQLDRLGFDADVMEDGQQALQRWQEQEYALLITDLHMPGMDGVALAKEIRRGESGRDVHLPVIVLTADVMQATAQRCLAAGIDDVLRKPVNLEQLARLLERWLPEASVSKSAGGQAGPELPTTVASSVIDHAALAKVMGLDDPVVLQEVLRDFLLVNRECMKQLAAAAAGADLGRLRQQAHKLSGSARTIGAAALAAQASQLEGAARDRQVDLIADLHARLEAAFADVAGEIEAAKPA